MQLDFVLCRTVLKLYEWRESAVYLVVSLLGVHGSIMLFTTPSFVEKVFFICHFRRTDISTKTPVDEVKQRGYSNMVKLDKKTREHYVKNIMTALHEAKKEGFRNLFLDLHPSDQLDVFITLNNEERERVYAFLTPNEFADIFGGLDTERQKQVFLEMDETYAYNMFNSMFTDDVAAFLTNINGTRAESILNNMDKDLAEKARTLISSAHETADSIMTRGLMHRSSTAQAADVLEKLRHDAPDAEIIYYLYVVDSEKRLVGVVSLRDLIVAPPNAVIKDVMSTRVISVTEDVDQEDVGKMIKKYDLLAL